MRAGYLVLIARPPEGLQSQGEGGEEDRSPLVVAVVGLTSDLHGRKGGNLHAIMPWRKESKGNYHVSKVVKDVGRPGGRASDLQVAASARSNRSSPVGSDRLMWCSEKWEWVTD
ncbi:hypothetical protein IF2G_08855 [Cordyceps javanica]|nr:hypothetical protein IF2G_08855 [Cordyceps javanica]